MEFFQEQVQRLSQLQLQNLAVLQMSTLDLEHYIQELALENPVIDLEEHSFAEESPRDKLVEHLRWIEENDQQNRRYLQHDLSATLDPLGSAGSYGGLEETLVQFVTRQLDHMPLDEHKKRTVIYLAACLDEDGYLRIPIGELADQTGVSEAYLQVCLTILRDLEPAGIGAGNLSECLELQLNRIGEQGPALSIVRNYLDAMANRHYRAIASQLDISVREVEEAGKIICALEPRPGAIFEQEQMTHYVEPDIIVREEDGRYIACVQPRANPGFQISRYYHSVFEQTKDEQVRDYLKGKIWQAESMLRAIEQRKSTLQLCAQAIVEWQQDFFRMGAQAMRALKLSDIAEKLQLHESTVSRAIHEKYLQCRLGTYPLRFFFSRNTRGEDCSTGGSGREAVKAALRALISAEDKAHPLSDQVLCEQLGQVGYQVSRRAVAKYRDEMKIKNAAGRKQW